MKFKVVRFPYKIMIIIQNTFVRFCIALEEMDDKDNPIAYTLGCSKPLTVRRRATIITAVPVVVTRAPEVARLDKLR